MFKTRGRVTQADVLTYRICDAVSGGLILLMLVLSPWAFGTTQAWAIWVMNVLGMSLGVLLLLKVIIRRLKGYAPPRWDTVPQPSADAATFKRIGRGLTASLAVVTTLLLLFCFISAFNGRATYVAGQLAFEYHKYLNWLPHSLDASRTWLWSWNYLALATSFWAARDWLFGKAESEVRRAASPAGSSQNWLPLRIKMTLWVLAINGALLGIEGIVQRVENSGNLLFLVKPRVNPGAESQFGPFAYRANASSYFNLVWPSCLALWWCLRHQRLSRKTHHVLLLCAAIMAACPVISTSRGGTIVTAGLILGSIVIVLFAPVVASILPKRGREIAFTLSGGQTQPPIYLRRHFLTLLLVLACSGIALGLAYRFGWKTLKPRMTAYAMMEGFTIREEMYERARPMVRDYPIYGTGPGTFATVFQMYRFSTETYWPAQLHNDWLETRITFGWLGTGLIFLALVCVAARPLFPGNIEAPLPLAAFIWLALTGCLVHARYDFPFQIYSILFLVVILCAILTTLSVSRKLAD